MEYYTAILGGDPAYNYLATYFWITPFPLAIAIAVAISIAIGFTEFAVRVWGCWG